MNILVTGGAGYIGSHTVLALLKNGYSVTIADNFSNSKPAVIERLKILAGKPFEFVRCEMTDAGQVDDLFAGRHFDAVIHFAGLKAVGESVSKPLEYYQNNIDATLTLLKAMVRYDVNDIIFSSSATVYGDPDRCPITEDMPLKPATNPYGSTKSMIEQILTDTQKARPQMKVCLLRYFNPLGADSSGMIGEDPNGIPNNLLPYITQVAVGKLKQLSVFGNDYPTPDGTCIRDYVHVADLAEGHVAALKYLPDGLSVFNLGTGKGTSVLEIIEAFKQATGIDIPYVIGPRRPGDVAENYADCTKAYQQLHWKARYDVRQMCADSYRWQSQNPNGYPD